jgi:hypothetical protein
MIDVPVDSVFFSGGVNMVSIIYENGVRKMRGEDITRGESWEGIGEYWSGYSALLTDMVGGLMLVKETTRGDGFSREIDYQLYALLDETSRDALCFYYGLQGRTKNSLDATTRCLNNLSFGGVHYNEALVNSIINEAIIKLSKCPEIQEYISGLTDGKCFGAAQ